MSTETEMPDEIRKTLLAAAVVLGVIAAVGNFGHVRLFAAEAGQPERMAKVIALLPDVLLVLSILRLKYDRRSLWAWGGLLGSVLFIGLASLATAGPTWADRVVALTPLGAAVIAAGLIESKPPAQQTPGEKTSRERRGTERARPTTGVAPSTYSSKSEPDRVAPSKTPAAALPPVAAGKAGPETPPSPGRPLHSVPEGETPDELLPDARTAAQKIRGRGEQVTKRTLMAQLRADGHEIGDRRALKLLKEVA